VGVRQLYVWGGRSGGPKDDFLADRTIGRDFGTLCRLSVCLSSVVCNVLYCGETVRSSEKLSEGVNRKPGSKT